MSILFAIVACGDPVPEPTCNPVPFAGVDDAPPSGDAGYVHCIQDGEGWTDRVAAVECPEDPRDLIGACPSTGPGCGAEPSCADGEFCGEGLTYYGSTCGCTEICTTDLDCDADQACVCAVWIDTAGGSEFSLEAKGECRPAGCRTGADCPSGECGVARSCCPTFQGLYCRSDADTCRSDADCSGSDRCQWEGAFVCGPSCSCE